MTQRTRKGFTLIELMIVIAIIGVLAIVAFPIYRDYMARSQATEAFQATSGLRSEIGTFAAENTGLAGAENDPTIVGITTTLDGRYIGQVSVDGGEISIRFDAGIHAGDEITLTAVESGIQIAGWTCGGDLASVHLPGACQ